MDLKLRVIQGKNVGQEVPVPGKKFLIGRAEDCNLRPGSDLISRHHCVLILDDACLVVRDFGSKNGTYVNDTRVEGECELKHGDLLRVGPLEFELLVEQGALSGKKKPPVRDPKEAAVRAVGVQPSEDDVSRWLESAPPAAATTAGREHAETQDTKLLRINDTDEIDIGTTRELELMIPSLAATAKPAAQPAPVAKAAIATPAPSPAKAPPTPKPAAVKPSVTAPAVSSPSPTPATAPAAAAKAPLPERTTTHKDSAPLQPYKPDAPEMVEDASTVIHDASKKTPQKAFGKLPQTPVSKDSREAAANVLNKFRKRR